MSFQPDDFDAVQQLGPAADRADPRDGSGQVDGSNNLVMNTRTEAYTYDDLNCLSTVDYGDGQTQSYGFDPMGNCLQKTDTK